VLSSGAVEDTKRELVVFKLAVSREVERLCVVKFPKLKSIARLRR